MIKICELIEKRRLALGYSSNYLSKKIGVDKQSLRTWRYGIAIPLPNKFSKIEKALKIKKGTLAKAAFNEKYKKTLNLQIKRQEEKLIKLKILLRKMSK